MSNREETKSKKVYVHDSIYKGAGKNMNRGEGGGVVKKKNKGTRAVGLIGYQAMFFAE